MNNSVGEVQGNRKKTMFLVLVSTNKHMYTPYFLHISLFNDGINSTFHVCKCIAHIENLTCLS